MHEMRSRFWIRTPVPVEDFASFHERGHVSSNTRPQEALRDPPKRGFIAMISGLMQRPADLLSERGRHNDTGRDSALVTVFQQVVFYD